MLLIHILIVGFFAIEISSNDSNNNHHRSRRIAIRKGKRHPPGSPLKLGTEPKKKRHKILNGTGTADLEIEVTTTSYNASDESTGYPDDYFLPPGATEVIDTYDYDQAKFNRSYLTQVEWKDDMTHRTHHYKVNEENDGFEVGKFIEPVAPVAPIQMIEPIKAIGLFS